MTGLPLDGRSVVVTRTQAQASGLVDRLAGLGADVVELPVIAVKDPADGGQALRGAVDRLASGHYAWVVFTSSNAVSRVLALLGDRPVPASTRWAAVGSGTARTLEEAGRPVDLVPAVSVAEELARSFPDAGSDAGSDLGTVLFPRAETVRGALVAGLEAKGWRVEQAVAYRTVAGEPTAEALYSAAAADAVAFTSSSTVQRALERLGAARMPPVVVTIGPVTTAAALAAGLTVAAEALPHTIEGLVEAVVSALTGEVGALLP